MFEFIKKETILIVSWLLALISMFFIKPDIKYLDYIDWKTLAILFSLMITVGGLRMLNVFTYTAQKLLSHINSRRGVAASLVFLCFFFSMIITNDVALITFVPFGIVVLKMAKLEDMLIKVTILQTLAANLGSMLTPVGNPQNLYLFSISDINVLKFILIMLPYSIAALILLIINIMFLKNGNVDNIKTENKKIKKDILIFILMFILCFIAIGKIIDYRITFIAILIVTIIKYRNLFKYVDFSLLATFAGFFIFIGNVGRIPFFTEFIDKIINGNEVAASIISSQIISNVPTALLLSGFSQNYENLIIGTNIGGLGTLIASMASLISYKQIAAECPKLKKKFFLEFTLYNIIYLAAISILHFIL